MLFAAVSTRSDSRCPWEDLIDGLSCPQKKSIPDLHSASRALACLLLPEDCGQRISCCTSPSVLGELNALPLFDGLLYFRTVKKGKEREREREKGNTFAVGFGAFFALNVLPS